MLQCDYQKDKMEKVAADYREGMDAHEPEHGEHDDDFNYMTREERRREDVEAIEEGVSSIVFKGGPLHRFIPMITNMLAHNLPVEASPAAVNAQASAVVALGKFMVNSRQLAEGQVDLISDVLARSHHACVKHAALSVLADMTMFIPNHPTLHQEDGQCFLTELLDDELLGRAALHQLLRLCNIRVVHAAAHLGALAAAMQYDSNVAIVKAFFASYLRTTGKQGRSTKETRARVIYKTYCDLPSKLSTEHKQNVMLQLITSFCDLGVEKELTTLLAKRLIEHVDATAASLLYERRTAAVYAVPGVVTQVEQRNLAALVDRISVAKDKLLSYSFPGNIRELKAIIELATIMCNGKTIQREDLQFNSPKKVSNFFLEKMTLREYNIKIVRHYLEKHDDSIPVVAKILGIGKTTIYRMLKEDDELSKKN